MNQRLSLQITPENIMRIGYARVSTQDQDLQTQLDALEKAGCEKVYKEKASAAGKRPALQDMLNNLRPGDEVVIYKLDRLGRSLKHLIELSEHFNTNDIQLISIKDSIDTTTATGRMMFNIIASFAEFERELIKERTRDAMRTARANGKQIGRPSKDEAVAKAKRLYATGTMTIKEICQTVGISRPTFYEKVKYAPQPQLKAVI